MRCTCSRQIRIEHMNVNFEKYCGGRINHLLAGRQKAGLLVCLIAVVGDVHGVCTWLLANVKHCPITWLRLRSLQNYSVAYAAPRSKTLKT